jgi:hypothetical protein
MMDLVAITPTKKPIKRVKRGDPLYVTKRVAKVFVQLGKAEYYLPPVEQPEPKKAAPAAKPKASPTPAPLVEATVVEAEQDGEPTDDEAASGDDPPRKQRRRTKKADATEPDA